jgi:hypothetical protein
MIVLSEFPKLNLQSGFESRWNCVHHPIKYKGTRKDLRINTFFHSGVFSGAEFLTLINLVGSVPSDVNIGDEIFFSNTNGAITGNTTVISKTATQIVCKKVNSVNFTGGYTNILSRKNYAIEVKVYGVNNSNAYVLAGSAIYKTDSKGNFELNVQGFLKNLVSFDDNFKYDVINKRFAELGSRFNISYREIWKGFEGVFSALSSSSVFYWTNATKQIQEKHNFNAGELVPFKDTLIAKFSSAFDVPTYFKDYPFSLTFIYSEKIAGYPVSRKEEQFNINGLVVSNTTDLLSISQNNFVNRLKIKENYPTTVEQIDVWLELEDSPIDYGYVGIGYVSPDYTKKLKAESVDLVTQ